MAKLGLHAMQIRDAADNSSVGGGDSIAHRTRLPEAICRSSPPFGFRECIHPASGSRESTIPCSQALPKCDAFQHPGQVMLFQVAGAAAT